MSVTRNAAGGAASICPLWSEYGAIDKIANLLPGAEGSDGAELEPPAEMSKEQAAAFSEFMDANR